MSDLSVAIVPKSDQLNTDDLISGPRTIVVTRVTVAAGTEQPVSIYYSGDNGKPYKPCKSMCRVLVMQWGPDGSTYTGRAITLYRDPRVTWAGLEVGGIRISHMSDIPADTSMALSRNRKTREIHTIKRLDRKPATLDTAASAQKPHGRIEDALPLIASFDGPDSALRAQLELSSWTREERLEISQALKARAHGATGPKAPEREPGED